MEFQRELSQLDLVLRSRKTEVNLLETRVSLLETNKLNDYKPYVDSFDKLMEIKKMEKRIQILEQISQEQSKTISDLLRNGMNENTPYYKDDKKENFYSNI